MQTTLNDLGVIVGMDLDPKTTVLCVMKSGVQVRIETPLTSEDVMALWGTRKREMKIPTGSHKYAVLRKRSVDYLHTFPME